MILTLMAIAMVVTEVTPSVPADGFYFDITTLQWWQALGGLLVLLGLSPAPWITALATGRLLFRADLERQLAEKDRVHEAAMAAKDEYYEATMTAREEYYDAVTAAKAEAYAQTQQALHVQEERNAKLADALGDSTAALEVMNHALIEFNEVAKAAT